ATGKNKNNQNANKMTYSSFHFNSCTGFKQVKGVNMNLPQFDGHLKKYTIEVKGVSNEQKAISLLILLTCYDTGAM
ncbi:MAG: hypothetical protein JW832_18625, partial [Deltaproteobacteria bacterium]|nr:hypothetical protein [Deltaproteobacteria bacterium]